MRRWLIPILAAVAAIVIVVLLVHDPGHPSSGGSTQARPSSSTRTALVATTMSPGLPAPISGEAVVASGDGLLILGGLDSSNTSVGGVFRMDTATGRLRPAGALSGPLHDAAAAALADRVLVIGGGSATSDDTVQSLPAGGGGAGARVVGHLPTVRSDLSAVTVGRAAYVLGGYDGQVPIDSVLRTGDGTSFSQIAALPAPARYMAVTALGGKIYAFGGETAGGGPSDAIQEVDPQRGSARVIAHLPKALSHASAVTLGGRIFILGGDLNGTASDRAWRFDPATRRASPAGRLPLAVSGGAAATVGSSAYLVGGTGAGGAALRTVIALNLKRKVIATKTTTTPTTPRARTTSSSRRAEPFAGRLLIADRGNNRLIVVDSHKRVLWRYPSHNHPAPPGGFYFPDDAFFTHHGAGIISNEEQNERIVQIAFPSRKLRWSYGHPGITGSAPGYLHEPDDAFLWRDGTVSVADAQNCRVLIVSEATKKVLRQFGSSGSCSHDPPRYLGSPNGDTPLANGDLLISEVNGSYIDEITRAGKLVWSVQLPIAYPSDPQQLGPNRYLVADYTTPGGIYEFNRKGKILWSYHPSSGHGMLDHPSLAERLPGGDIAVNDDYRHRVVIVDPRTRRIVWQYGRTDNAGRGANHLNTPDGFDLLAPSGATPTHPSTG